MSSADYIIIGGGTSGLVIANRLSENPDVQVLVLEAGQDLSNDPRVTVPAFWTTLIGTDADWQFQSVPQHQLGGRIINEAQGKGLGGSSAINCQAYIAPSQAGIDAWGQFGNPGWDWAGLSPYYKKATTLSLPPDQDTRDHLGIDWIDKSCHGTNGPIQVSFPGVVENPLIKAWIDAFRGRDELTTNDPFSGHSVGGYSCCAAVDSSSKTRSYAGNAYGLPAAQRPNLRIITGAKVAKVTFKTESDMIHATGVKASINGGELETFIPAREVILAAGVFNTPKILELSGIGNKDILKRHSIPVVVDLPGVGENLQDHLMTGVSYEVAEGVLTGDPLLRQEPEAISQAQGLYFEHQKGPFTIGGIQSHAFMPTPKGTSDELFPTHAGGPEDSELTKVIYSILDNSSESSAAWFMFLAQANLHESGKSFTGSRFMPENFASLGCSQSYPLSRGSTHISSTNIDAAPDIDPRYFPHPLDLEIMARHVQALENLRNAKELEPFFKLNGKRNHPDAFNIGSLEGAKKYVLDTATTSYHSCGTAAMLPKDKGGVIDAKLLVHGVSNLRVVDASIFPMITRGNPMATVYAVAEKAADIIKNH
ncbi:hypothetical protein NW762_009004 [Fusarium torreyae]|uniref:Glucose-methanol-choline oxidoreductase N-terminal domain-containing protein n=1 Tax=Fusarium torreyae TaxID=1237075 RepID=A0A9W8VCG3_9HYPO|nr:hypothetical protein NW762_009004 [Fusarium torreyae]